MCFRLSAEAVKDIDPNEIFFIREKKSYVIVECEVNSQILLEKPGIVHLSMQKMRKRNWNNRPGTGSFRENNKK